MKELILNLLVMIEKGKWLEKKNCFEKEKVVEECGRRYRKKEWR